MSCTQPATYSWQQISSQDRLAPCHAPTHALPTHPCSELLAIRHCVFLMGPAGCGRSEVIQVLARAVTAGCTAPTNPYLQVNNKKKVRVQGQLGGGGLLGLSGWEMRAWAALQPRHAISHTRSPISAFMHTQTHFIPPPPLAHTHTKHTNAHACTHAHRWLCATSTQRASPPRSCTAASTWPPASGGTASCRARCASWPTCPTTTQSGLCWTATWVCVFVFVLGGGYALLGREKQPGAGRRLQRQCLHTFMRCCSPHSPHSLHTSPPRASLNQSCRCQLD